MSTENQARYNLEGGPSKMDLMMGLFGGGANGSRTVRFEIEGEPVEGGASNGVILAKGRAMYRSVVVKLTGLERDDSGEDWLFKGQTTLWSQYVEGSFNTRTRKGSIDFGQSDPQMREVRFAGGDVIFGFDTAIMINDQIIALRGEREGELVKGMVAIRGDSHGYVPGSLKAGLACIVGFRLPFTDGETDHIVQVRDASGNIGWIKPSHIVR